MINEVEKIKERINYIECAERMTQDEKEELSKLQRKFKEMESLPVLENSSVSNLNNDFSQDKIELIKKTICAGATNDELQLFIEQCKRTGLNPFARQIYSVPYGKKRTIQISIDGFRLIAERSGKYIGQKPAQWCGRDGIWRDVWTEKEKPFAARVGILRKDFAEPIYFIAYWDSYALDSYGKVKEMYEKNPCGMLAKCSESGGLRVTFPQELSGLYSPEEMGSDVINIVPQQIKNEIYESNNGQKKFLVDVLHELGLKKHEKISEDYLWFSDRLVGTKMEDLKENVLMLMEKFKSTSEEH